MIEFYPEIRLVHVAAVVLSGGLFFLRGLALGLGQSWARAAPIRYFAYAVDTTWLTAAFMLMTVLDVYPFVQNWLTVKVLLLVVYVVLAFLALSGRRGRSTRLTLWSSALVIYLFVFTIARTHHPLGLFATL